MDSIDCLVVGAGPVGLAFALEAADSGKSVLLVDAGSARSARKDIPPRADGPDTIVDPRRHAPVQQVMRRGIGGTSWLWGGRCVAFEPIDFERRSFVIESGWPLTIDDIRPWEAAAAGYLDCGSAEFRAEAPTWLEAGDCEVSRVERWARRPRLADRLGRRVREHPGITVLLESSVVDIDFASGDTVSAIVVESRGVRQRLSATTYVLAMGGLEITRLLLRIQRAHPSMFGGPDGPLGRYYMGHATGRIADVVFADADHARNMDFQRDSDGTYLRRRFTLSELAQHREEILNTSFYIDNPDFHEASHRNPTLSLVYLGLVIPFIGRRLLAEAIRLRHIGSPPRRIGAHIVNVLRNPWRAASDVADVLRRRYLSAARKPGFLLRTGSGRYAVVYHAEQTPNGESRLTLLPGGDGARLRIDFRYTEQDIDSVWRAHGLLDAQLRAAGIGFLEYRAATEEGIKALIWEQATDGFHSIGTTRMSAAPASGVVDSDCRVHGLRNLYIASSSVFCSSGEANPTFLATCLAVRLAHHLSQAVADHTTIPEAVVDLPAAS